jgi:hypothetical protein
MLVDGPEDGAGFDPGSGKARSKARTEQCGFGRRGCKRSAGTNDVADRPKTSHLSIKMDFGRRACARRWVRSVREVELMRRTGNENHTKFADNKSAI